MKRRKSISLPQNTGNGKKPILGATMESVSCPVLRPMPQALISVHSGVPPQLLPANKLCFFLTKVDF